jgi:hypothetical protein
MLLALLGRRKLFLLALADIFLQQPPILFEVYYVSY